MNTMNLTTSMKDTEHKLLTQFSNLIPTQRGRMRHYVFAALLMTFALWLRMQIAPIDEGLQYLTFFPAVALAAVAGGFLPGLFATVIGLFFATYIFTPPHYEFSIQALHNSLWSNLVFFIDGLIVSFSIETMHRYRQKYTLKLQQAADTQKTMKDSSRQLEINLSEMQALLQRNQTLLQNSMEGIHIMDVEGNVIEANSAFCDMLGYTKEEALGLNVADWDAHWSHEQLSERFKSFIGKSAQFETEHRRKDGSVIVVEITCCGVEIGGKGYLYASSRDITQRKQVEAELLRYKQVIDTALDGFWVTDLQGNILDVNEAYAEMSGYTVAELQKMHISQLEAKEQHQDVAAHIAKLITQGYDRFETRHRCKDGHVVEIEVAATYASQMQQFFVFCRDITERKQAEEALRVAAVTFETHDAILITDANANIIRVNQAFTDITGYTADEVLGKNPRIMSSGRQDRKFYLEMWQQLRHTGTWAGEIWDKRRNGQIYPKWLTISAVKNEYQEISHYVAIFSDITARKQAEEEIRNLAFYDVLTGLPNRRLFMDRFRAALTISARHNDYGAVLFIDLDRFKQLNDTLGHDYGDLLLIEVAKRTKSCVREMDTVARLGGDEFVVLIEGLSVDQHESSRTTALVAEKIREALARPYQLKSHKYRCSPSIGISLFRGNTRPVDDLIRQADIAMYQAKSSGRNAVCFFDQALPEQIYPIASASDLDNSPT